MKTYMVKFATVSSHCCSIHSEIETSCQCIISKREFRKDHKYLITYFLLFMSQLLKPPDCYLSSGGVWSPGSSGHIRLCGRHQAGQTGRAVSKSDVTMHYETPV